MGFVAVNDESLHKSLRFLQNALGNIPSPFDCYMVLRGVKTLSIRMKQHSQNGMQVASFLQSHPKVSKVVYPGIFFFF